MIRSVRLLAVAFPLLLAGCASLGPGSPVMPETPAPATTDIDVPQLPPLAIRDHRRVLDAFGGAVERPALTKIADDILARLAPHSDRPDLRYRFTILNSGTVNAFALPSGQIYVTRGMVALINDTSEFAAVLGHEMAHVFSSHAAMREDRAKTDEIVAALKAKVLNDPAGAAQRRETGKLSLATFSRAQELEADQKGIALIARAGFDPRGAARILAALDRHMRLNAGAGPDGFLATHPTTPERVEQAIAAARQHSAPGVGERDHERVLAAIDGLAYGEDAGSGIVRGRDFLHPTLGFGITAPQGFSLENGKEAVTGTGPNDLALRLDTASVPEGKSLRDYLTSGWIEGLVPESIADVSVNGIATVTGIARGPEWSFRVYVLRHGGKLYRVIYAARTLDAASDEQFSLSMGTFHALSMSEIAEAQPLRVRIIRVGDGEASDLIAARMGAIDHPFERFRLINGLNAGEDPPAGTLVKVLKP